MNKSKIVVDEVCTIKSYNDFCRLYDKYSPILYSFVLSLSRSKIDAEEIVQDTFLKLWIKRDTIDSTKSIRSWLFMIAKNRFIDLYRSRMRDPKFAEYMECHIVDEQDYSHHHDSSIRNFDEFKKQLEIAKQDLSDRQREIFELSREQGYTAAEIAQILDLSEQVVHNQVSIATKKLREKMRKYRSLFMLFLY